MIIRCAKAHRKLGVEIAQALQAINWFWGRGEVVEVAFRSVSDNSPKTMLGTVTRRIPTTQATGFTEDRKFRVIGKTVFFLGHQYTLQDKPKQKVRSSRSTRVIRYFELVDPSRNHDKFWEVLCDDKIVNVRYGRRGTLGQVQVKTFANFNAAMHHVSKLINVKLRKGYLEKKPTSLTGPIYVPLVRPVEESRGPMLPKNALSAIPEQVRRMRVTRRKSSA